MILHDNGNTQSTVYLRFGTHETIPSGLLFGASMLLSHWFRQIHDKGILLIVKLIKFMPTINKFY
jgi:hypothetical protein